MLKKTKSNPSALELIKKCEQSLTHECTKRIYEMSTILRDFDGNWEERITEIASFIIDAGNGIKTLRKTIFDLKDFRHNKQRYQVSSKFLEEDSWKYLTSDPRRNERLHIVTGTITENGTRVLSRIEKVKFEKQSQIYVSAEREDSHKKIVSLGEKYGHPVLALFHSHISEGASSTNPSQIDIATLERHHKIGVECIGGIFSLDGFIRFYSLKDFEIEVYGKGVEKIQDDPTNKIYKILNDRRKS